MVNNNTKKDKNNFSPFGPRRHGPGRGMGIHGAIKGDKAKNSKETIIRIWQYIKEHKIKLFFIVFLVVLGTLANIAGPMLIGIAIDDFISIGNLDGLIKIVLLMGVLYILSSLFVWLQTYIMVGISQKSLFRLREDLFNNIQRLSLSYFDKHSTGDIMSRITNDVENISNTLTHSVTQLVSSIITILGVLVIMFSLNWILALVTILTVPISLITIGKIGKYSRKFFSTQQKLLGNLNGFIEETVTGIRVIKTYSKEDEVCNEFDKQNKDLKQISIKAQILSGLIGPINIFISNFGFAILVAIGALLTLQGRATVGLIASFINYSHQFRRPIQHFAGLYATIQSALAGAERVFEVMDEKPELLDKKDAQELDLIKGSVTFEKVNFSYKKDIPILKDISLQVLPGEMVALVGPTGAGKTTIINLLTRFYDIDSGSIKIDNIDIADIKKHSLRKSIGIVLQDTYLFIGTVKDNIRYGRLNATDEEVIKASKMANAHQFIYRLPMGYNTELTEEGNNISQGQRQLISIARAILADPQILILDEATSSVDTRTELQLQKGMKMLMKGRTSFVIAHRLSTVREADKILVIHDGKIIEEGAHKELLGNKGFYYNLYMSQFANN